MPDTVLSAKEMKYQWTKTTLMEFISWWGDTGSKNKNKLWN